MEARRRVSASRADDRLHHRRRGRAALRAERTDRGSRWLCFSPTLPPVARHELNSSGTRVLVEVDTEILSEPPCTLVGHDHPPAAGATADPSQAEQTVAECGSECTG